MKRQVYKGLNILLCNNHLTSTHIKFHFFYIMKRLLLMVLTSAIFVSCDQKTGKADHKILTNENLVHENVDQLTRVIIHDVFSPPVSSRIYAYTSLAAYEAIRHSKQGHPSFTEKLSGFPVMPKPLEGVPYNYLLASTKAFFTVAEKVTFSKDTL